MRTRVCASVTVSVCESVYVRERVADSNVIEALTHPYSSASTLARTLASSLIVILPLSRARTRLSSRGSAVQYRRLWPFGLRRRGLVLSRI